jgi:hypothetical protein
MRENNRVLVRIGARELTAEEVKQVAGGATTPHTETVCSVNPATGTADGDVGEC